MSDLPEPIATLIGLGLVLIGTVALYGLVTQFVALWRPAQADRGLHRPLAAQVMLLIVMLLIFASLAYQLVRGA